MRECVLPLDEMEWGALRPGEQVTLSGRVFLGGNEALNRVAYTVQEGHLTNLELEGCVWMYALPQTLKTRPLSFTPEWLRTPLPKDFFEIFGLLGMAFAGTPLPEGELLEKNGVRALVPKAADAVLSPGDGILKDKIARVKGVWWMSRGLRAALWELEVCRAGVFVRS
jgi:tartrate dehydratase beta subunit/fumarate hydratase class I family protein